MTKVFLGVGHGGNDSGAVANGHKEKDMTLKIANACKAYLEANGISVKMSRYRDENDPVGEEVSECNAYNPSLAIDIHINAGGGDGFEVFHTVSGGTGKTLAQNIEKEVVASGQNSRGIKTRKNSSGKDYYAFIRKTKCPAVICELGFIDNLTDLQAFDEDHELKAFGEAYARGILTTLGMGSGTAPTAPVTGTGAKYSVGTRVRFSTCYKSSTAPNSEAILSSNMSKDNGTITKIVAGAKNPYLLDGGLCWVNDGDIREVLNSSNSQSANKGGQIAVDGKWGKDTTLKAQRIFGTTADGIVSNQYDDYKSKNPGLLSATFEWEANPGKNGSLLIKKIQNWCDVNADGFIGPSTIKAMQRKLGTPVDGVVSNPSTMVKAFQNWLNAQ